MEADVGHGGTVAVERPARRNQAVDELRTAQQLVDAFTEACIAIDRAELEGENWRFKPLMKRLFEIEHELRDRLGDQRRELAVLYGHRNAEVRLQAAMATLAVLPSAARQMLQLLSASRRLPQAAEASMTLKALDEGKYKPS